MALSARIKIQNVFDPIFDRIKYITYLGRPNSFSSIHVKSITESSLQYQIAL